MKADKAKGLLNICLFRQDDTIWYTNLKNMLCLIHELQKEEQAIVENFWFHNFR